MPDPTLRAGDAVAHYRIVDLLGAGGMGEVYVAEDERLHRKVALKLLPDSLAHDPARVRRFEQEARTASALSHPNIVTVFDLGQAGSRTFITTELVAGRTLREEIRAHGRIPVAEAIQIARQCAAALAAAHAAGIVHRDIKPENVMVRPDRLVKLLDFGLAKIDTPGSAESDTVTKLTALGTVVGTVAYLSPEQARGLTVDARTDIFSLGVMLYEMIAGVRPFTGDTDNDTIAAILRETPAPLKTHLPRLPPGLQTIFDKALAKDRDRRYATMAELSQDLEQLSTGLSEPSRRQPVPISRRAMAAGVVVFGVAAIVAWFAWPFTGSSGTTRPANAVAPVRTLAVIPFKLIGGATKESQHLGLALADALIVKLTNQRQVTVRPTNAVMRYAEADPDAGEAGRTLQVDAVLMGTVQLAGDRVRVRAQLIRTPAANVSPETIWTDEFPDSAADLLELQDRLAASVVERLAIQLSRDEQQRLAKRDTANAQAYRLYLEGRYFMNRRTEEGYRQAIVLNEQAATLDPQFARPHVTIAICWSALIEIGVEPPSAMARVQAALSRALSLDDTLGEALAYQAFVSRINDWKFADAQRQSDRSVELEPNHPRVLEWRGVHLLATGRGDEAVAIHRRATEIDPLDLSSRSQLARALYLTKQYDEALSTGLALIQLDEAQSPAHQWVGSSYSALGRHADAFRHLERALALSPKSAERQASLAHAYGIGGRPQDARRLLAELTASERIDHYQVATVHTALRDTAAAFSALEHARQQHNAYLANRLALDPKLDPLRGDPRFQPLLRELGLR